MNRHRRMILSAGNAFPRANWLRNETIKQGRPTFAVLVLKSICSWLNESLVLPAFVEDVAKFKGPARFV